MRLGLVIGVLLCAVPSIVAGEPSAIQPDGSEVFPLSNGREDPFSQGAISIEASGAYASPIRFSENELGIARLGLNYYFLDHWSIGIHGTGSYIDQSGDDATAGGVEAFLRWHLLRIDRFTIYADGGGGRFTASEATPPGGTTYNWTGRVGGGATFEINDTMHLMAGARYLHYSNGNEHTRMKNPSYDGVEYYIGVMWTF